MTDYIVSEEQLMELIKSVQPGLYLSGQKRKTKDFLKFKKPVEMIAGGILTGDKFIFTTDNFDFVFLRASRKDIIKNVEGKSIKIFIQEVK